MTNVKLSYQQHNTLTSVVHNFITSTRTSGTENTQDSRAGKRPGVGAQPAMLMSHLLNFRGYVPVPLTPLGFH
jgi:hypothetical protein